MDPWTAGEAVNARTMPLVYGTLLCFTAFVLFWRTPASADGPDLGRLMRVAGVLLAAVSFVFVLNFLSLWIALALLIAALACWLGERRLHLILTLMISVPLIGWLGIEIVLGLHLPG